MNSMIAIANVNVASVSMASDMVAVRDLGISQRLDQRLYQRGRERTWRHTTVTCHCPASPVLLEKSGKPKPASLKPMGRTGPSFVSFGFGEAGTGGFGIGSSR